VAEDSIAGKTLKEKIGNFIEARVLRSEQIQNNAMFKNRGQMTPKESPGKKMVKD
jgi:hypothetical protein